jgi:hypothetical protein
MKVFLSRRTRFSQGWPLAVTLLALACAHRAGVAGCPNPCNLRIHDGPGTRRVALRWDAPTNPPVREYIVYRNGYEIDRMDPANFGFLGPFKEELHMLPGRSYAYQVAAVFTNGTLSGLSNPLNVTALTAPPRTGTNQIVTVLLRCADFPDTPFPTSDVDAMMFTRTNSVKKYMDEVSFGKFTIEGSTHGWYTLPRPASNYCTTLFPNGLWYFCNFPFADIYSVVPPAVSNLIQTADQVQFAIHGMGTVGEAGGKFAFYSATNGFERGTIIHELGHTFGFLHASTLISCTGYPLGPDLVHMRTNNCFTLLYGDRYDPMGGGATVHYNSFFKEQAGWLPTNNIQWITTDGDYTLHAIEHPTNAVQTLRIDLGGEMFWFLEYRTPTGFDGPTTPEPPAGGPIDGVLMHVRVSRFILADWDTFWISPVARTNTPWFDPFSGLCVNVLSQNGTNATVRITGLNYAFRLTDTQRIGANARLTWNAVPGARYLLQGSATFTSWTTLATSVDATNRTMIFTLPNAATPAFRYFRAAVDTGP